MSSTRKAASCPSTDAQYNFGHLWPGARRRTAARRTPERSFDPFSQVHPVPRSPLIASFTRFLSLARFLFFLSPLGGAPWPLGGRFARTRARKPGHWRRRAVCVVPRHFWPPSLSVSLSSLVGGRQADTRAVVVRENWMIFPPRKPKEESLGGAPRRGGRIRVVWRKRERGFIAKDYANGSALDVAMCGGARLSRPLRLGTMGLPTCGGDDEGRQQHATSTPFFTKP